MNTYRGEQPGSIRSVLLHWWGAGAERRHPVPGQAGGPVPVPPPPPQVSDQAHFWEAARSLGFSQELVFVKRQEKGETVIKRVDLGSEFTEGPQELDTISPACPAAVKRGCGSHMGAASPSTPERPEMEKQLRVQEEMSRGALPP